MKKARRSTRRSTTSRRPNSRSSGHLARRGPAALRSWTTGALPIVEDFLQRMKLEALLEEFLPGDDRRTKIPSARTDFRGQGLKPLNFRLIVQRGRPTGARLEETGFETCCVINLNTNRMKPEPTAKIAPVEPF